MTTPTPLQRIYGPQPGPGVVPAWPDYAHIERDGFEIAHRGPVRRMLMDDGMARQWMAGTVYTRICTFRFFVLSAADKDRFDAWVVSLGASSEFRMTVRPEGMLWRWRIQGGRGGVRWRSVRVRSSGNQQWGAEITIESVASPYELDLACPAPLKYALGVAIAPVVLPAPVGASEPVSYALEGDLPSGLHYDPATRTLSGTPRTATTATVRYVVRDARGVVGVCHIAISVYAPWRAEGWSPSIRNTLSSAHRLMSSDQEPAFPAAWSVDGVASTPRLMGHFSPLRFLGLWVFELRRRGGYPARLRPDVERDLRATVTGPNRGGTQITRTWQCTGYGPLGRATGNTTRTKGGYHTLEYSGRDMYQDGYFDFAGSEGPFEVTFFLAS